jgi:hypothetical protein
MKKYKIKFIKSSICLSFIILIIFTLFNNIYLKKVIPKKLIHRKEASWQKYKTSLTDKTLEYAFLGDSHVLFGLNPELVKDSYNFADVGQDYVETYYIYNKILEKDKIQINNIVAPLDTHTFSNNIRTKERLFRQSTYYSRLVPAKDFIKLKDTNRLNFIINKTFPLLGNGNELFNLFFPPEITNTYYGWISVSINFQSKNTKQRNISTEKRINLHFPNSNVESLINEKSFSYFKKIAQLSQQNKTSLTFIKMPISREYNNKIIEKNIQREQYYNRIFNELDNLNIKYKVLDYYKIFFNNPEYFYDPDHLNSVGAEILSKRLATDLENLK